MDAFTLLRQAIDLVPEGAEPETGLMVGQARAYQREQEWEMVLSVLMEIGEAQALPSSFWVLLADAARQMMLEHDARWCEWRQWEAQHGTIRAALSLVEAGEDGRRTAFSGDGQLRPMWDIGHCTPEGERELHIARLWVELVPTLGPGESATVRLAPLDPARWRHLRPGDVITMHEIMPVSGKATIVEIVPPVPSEALT